MLSVSTSISVVTSFSLIGGRTIQTSRSFGFRKEECDPLVWSIFRRRICSTTTDGSVNLFDRISLTA